MRFFYVIIIFLSACKTDSKKNELNSTEKLYFDLINLVQSDIYNNSINDCSETKTVIINGKIESKNIDSISWKNELQLLLDSDINKPNWKGKYNVQILKDSGKYIYTSNTTKIPISKMTVNYEHKNGKITSIEIDKKIATILFSNEQHIIYYPNKSFKINAKQSALFMKDFNSVVEIKYLCRI